MAVTKRILIVDDDRFVRTTLRDVLVDSGYELEEASDGIAALEAVDRFKPDLVLLDLLMPRKSGLEVLSDISQRNPQTRVLVISHIDAESLIQSALDAGATGFIAKPFHPIEILTAVDEALK
jgi:two-component system chemotaxis response regulator CheY